LSFRNRFFDRRIYTKKIVTLHTVKLIQFKTTWGTITLTLDGGGKPVALDLPPLTNTPRKEFKVLSSRFSGLNAALFFQALRNQFPGFDIPPGTAFQQAVWRTLTTIPCGEIRTYGDIAAKAGYPGACRAAGSACGKNPLPVFIPCHRVVAANGPGGFSSGLPWKKLLLEMERVTAPS
jgi:O-6-methylguanine DNA methyltransferase